MASTVRIFQGRANRTTSGGVTILFPFDPAEAWGPRDRYHITGTIGGIRVRTTLVYRAGSWHIDLGPKSGSAAPLTDGETVDVEVWPEGPQSEQLAPDIAEALAARPRAQSAFDGLATFYRKGWLRWIEGTKRRPEVRAERIAEMVRLVEAGHKERP
jgi:bacteriocin resistance YdeI/OmpD-like protein/uncharacterized protein DUF1905